MMKHLTLMVGLGFLASIAVAGGMEADGSKQRFQMLDKDDNGHISLYEARDRHRIFWYYQKADQNFDGHIDEAEFSAFEAEVPDFESK